VLFGLRDLKGWMKGLESVSIGLNMSLQSMSIGNKPLQLNRGRPKLERMTNVYVIIVAWSHLGKRAGS